MLAIKKRDARTGTEGLSLRYVTEAEIKGAVVKNGDSNLSLKPYIKSISSLAKGEIRQIVIQGQVHGVHALR